MNTNRTRAFAILSGAFIACAILPAAVTPAAAQGTSSTSGCEATPAKQAPTPTAHGENSGTQPGSSGSTGWSGGTGGSNIGTTPGSPTPGSPTEHPPTVQGVSPSVVGPTRKDC